MARKNLIELVDDEPRGPASPAKSANRHMDDPRVLGDRQVRAERKLLVNRAQPERFGARRGIGRSSWPAMTSRPRSGATPPFKMCMSVDLPAPLWPTTPTHSPPATEKSTPSRAPDSAVRLSTPSSVTKWAGGSDIVGGTDRRLWRAGQAGAVTSSNWPQWPLLRLRENTLCWRRCLQACWRRLRRDGPGRSRGQARQDRAGCPCFRRESAGRPRKRACPGPAQSRRTRTGSRSCRPAPSTI